MECKHCPITGGHHSAGCPKAQPSSPSRGKNRKKERRRSAASTPQDDAELFAARARDDPVIQRMAERLKQLELENKDLRNENKDLAARHVTDILSAFRNLSSQTSGGTWKDSTLKGHVERVDSPDKQSFGLAQFQGELSHKQTVQAAKIRSRVVRMRDAGCIEEELYPGLKEYFSLLVQMAGAAAQLGVLFDTTGNRGAGTRHPDLRFTHLGTNSIAGHIEVKKGRLDTRASSDMALNVAVRCLADRALRNLQAADVSYSATTNGTHIVFVKLEYDCAGSMVMATRTEAMEMSHKRMLRFMLGLIQTFVQKPIQLRASAEVSEKRNDDDCWTVEFDDLTLGRRCKYQLKSFLGEGLVTRVFRGWMDGQEVTVKELRYYFFWRKYVEKVFETETSALVRLEAIDGVPQMVAQGNLLGSETGKVIVMKHTAGRDLSQVERPMPDGDVADILARLVHVLFQVHARGIIHRDIAPTNVIITPEGQAQLIDFGRAAQWPVVDDAQGRWQFCSPWMSMEKSRQGPWDDFASLAFVGEYLRVGQVPWENCCGDVEADERQRATTKLKLAFLEQVCMSEGPAALVPLLEEYNILARSTTAQDLIGAIGSYAKHLYEQHSTA